MGAIAVTNKEVARLAKARPLSITLAGERFKLLGHVLRRAGSDPARAVAYDRFGHPKELRATRRAGVERQKWTREVMDRAASALEEEGLLAAAEGGRGHRYTRVAALAQDREAWKKWIKRWSKKYDWEHFK